MYFVFLIQLILWAGGVLANAEISNNAGQLLSLYMENSQKTASKIMELNDQLPLFIEVAQGQKDLVLALLEIRQLSFQKDKIIESMFSYNEIAKLVESQFFINFNYQTDEDENIIVFKGKFFLSNYINMYWLNKMGLDDEASLQLLFSYFIDPMTKNFLIQQGVLDNISSQYLEVPSPDLSVITKAQNSQKKYQSELCSIELIKKKLQESTLFMNITMYSQEKVLKKYQEVFTKIEPYFFIFTTHELDSIFKEVMELTLSELHEQIMIENTIFEALYNRTPILLDPNSISYGFQEIDQYMISAYFEKEDTAMPYLLQYYKDVHVQLIEIPEDQYENFINRIASMVNQSEKQVQTKIIKSSLSLKHIELLIKSNCLKNEGLDEIKIIFKDKKYLLSLIIEIHKNLKDGLPYEDAIKAASFSLKPRVGTNQFYRIASALFQKDVGGAFSRNDFWTFLRNTIGFKTFRSIFGYFFEGDARYFIGSYWSSYFPNADIRIIIDRIQDSINSYSIILYESEIKLTFKMFKAYLEATYESFKKDNKSEESKIIILEFYWNYVQDILIKEIERRQPYCIDFKLRILI